MLLGMGIADTVIQANCYRPFDSTEKVREACARSGTDPAARMPEFRFLCSDIPGEPVSVHFSAMHDCHAVSVIRRLLNTDPEDIHLTKRVFSLPVTDTKT